MKWKVRNDVLDVFQISSQANFNTSFRNSLFSFFKNKQPKTYVVNGKVIKVFFFTYTFRYVQKQNGPWFLFLGFGLINKVFICGFIVMCLNDLRGILPYLVLAFQMQRFYWIMHFGFRFLSILWTPTDKDFLCNFGVHASRGFRGNSLSFRSVILLLPAKEKEIAR